MERWPPRCLLGPMAVMLTVGHVEWVKKLDFLVLKQRFLALLAAVGGEGQISWLSGRADITTNTRPVSRKERRGMVPEAPSGMGGQNVEIKFVHLFIHSFTHSANDY